MRQRFSKILLAIIFIGLCVGFFAGHSNEKIFQSSSGCTRDGGICLSRVESPLRLPNYEGQLQIYEGQTWGISWGDADNNAWPDLYLNHHTERNTAGRFPTSHLIFDMGHDIQTENFRELRGGDQHTAIFLDIDHDGDQEIVETIGGRRGAADVSDMGTWNRVYDLHDDYVEPSHRAKILGLNDPAARGRSIVPFRIADIFAIALMNAPRDDGFHPAVIFQEVDGVFGAIHEGMLCMNSLEVCWEVPVSKYKSLVWGHINDDQWVDLFFYDPIGDSEATVLFGGPGGEVVNGRTYDLGFSPKSSFLGDVFGAGTMQIIMADLRKIAIFDMNEDGLEKINAVSKFDVERWLPKSQKIRDIGAADLDNDGDLEIISFHSIDGSENIFLVWDYGDDGIFRPTEFKIPELNCSARNFAISDFDVNGSIDVLFGSGKGAPFPDCKGGYSLWKSEPSNNWIEVDIADDQGLRGLGARVVVEVNGRKIVRGQYGGIRGEVQDHIRLHFGLGDSEVANIHVTWSDGRTTEIGDFAVNQVVTIDSRALQD